MFYIGSVRVIWPVGARDEGKGSHIEANGKEPFVGLKEGLVQMREKKETPIRLGD
jgi:hypothetical protein